MSNWMKPTALALTLATMTLGAAQASAQTVTFTTTGNMSTNGTYGNILPTYNATTPVSSALKLQVSGWQVNQTTNAITSAYIGAYSTGLGVTGVNDSSGDYNYHQFDNALGYNDFVLLQFSEAVTLKSLTLYSYALGSATSKDNDLAFYAAAFPETNWNSSLNLSAYTVPVASWTTVSGSGTDGNVVTGAVVASKEWLVSAAFNSGGNDGFKISSITVATAAAVPEPATWGMMILGFGMVGGAMRSRRGKGVAVATA